MYQFDSKRHIHTFDGKPLTGVTTVLGVISKGDGLIQWSANEAIKYAKENYIDKGTDEKGDYYTISDEILEEAKKAWKNTRDKAAEQGTDVHAIIEEIVKRAISKDGYIDITEHENKQVDNFVKWALIGKIKFLESEKNVYSKELWTGGIVDFVFERDGKVFIGDIKTSKDIYPTYFWQTSAYQYMLQEMGLYPEVYGFVIVRVGKDGSFETKENYAYEDNIEGFKSALTIYRKLNLIK